MYQKKLKLLFRSFDDQLNADERQQLADALSKSPQLREKKLQLERLRNDISDVRLQPAKPFLAERVLQRVAMSEEAASLEERFWEALFYTFRRVAVATALCVLVVFGIYLASEGIVFANDEVVIEDILETDAFIAMGVSQ